MVALNPIAGSRRCPCTSGLSFGECCGKYHAGAKAPTAEALMRSRFSAFVSGDEDYLLRTWDPVTRPGSLDLADSPIRFYRLDILDSDRLSGALMVHGSIPPASFNAGHGLDFTVELS